MNVVSRSPEVNYGMGQQSCLVCSQIWSQSGGKSIVGPIVMFSSLTKKISVFKVLVLKNNVDKNKHCCFYH